ncbi:MAG TPA: MFS transporter, partial [Candidatus Binataceae bacterium]|nr:MFS transporter [Candidatus Binataceae bacterium]
AVPTRRLTASLPGITMSRLWNTIRKYNPARLSKRQRRVLAIVSTAGIFNDYDGELVNLVLPQIQEGLNLSASSLAPMVSLIKLGALIAPFITVQADRFGRRRLLMLTIVGYTIFTGVTAIAWSGLTFAAFRIGATAFSSAEGSIALVMLVEEMSNERRGIAVGLLGALSSLGFGIAALAYSRIDIIPLGWRGLYIFALVPLFIIVPIRRLLPESVRFERNAVKLRDQKILGPFQALIHSYPKRFALVAVAMVLSTFAGTPGGLFQSMYLERKHHWTPGEVSLLVLAGGVLGICGNVIAGGLSDKFGRRYVGSFFLIIAPLLGAAFYNTSGGIMAGAWMIELFANTAASTVLNAYSVELFPTSHRATASSSLTVVNTLGGILGLLIEPLLYAVVGTTWRAVSLIYMVGLGSAAVVLLLFPETARQELDELSPERYTGRTRRRVNWPRSKAASQDSIKQAESSRRERSS